ncbi:cyclase [Mycolicibacterium smegmatis]|nr:hypothetical protein [Mycolicibacterium smegmatis]SUA33824.1 cyclase [Mycolicibacterium smegmatis]
MTQLHTSTADLGGDAVKLVDELCLKYRNWGGGVRTTSAGH